MTKEYIYETPFMEIICFSANDVITSSEDGVTVPELGFGEDVD